MLDNKDFKLSQHGIVLEKAIAVHWFCDIMVTPGIPKYKD
jgi:hypothetical protein